MCSYSRSTSHHDTTHCAMIYLLNSPVLTAYGIWRFSGALTPTQARERIRGQQIESAVGHGASALLLSRLLLQPVAVTRKAVVLDAGDQALVLRLLQRLPEGVVLDEDAIMQVPFELAWLEFFGDMLPAACPDVTTPAIEGQLT